MVILGSRGRSALKGQAFRSLSLPSAICPPSSILQSIKTNLTPSSVLLGSFSNYLVTKSSVPVMVARRKLKKHAKDRKINPRLSNNLTLSRLETAVID